jgi:hypothetical protein
VATTNRKRRKLRSGRSATEKIREADREIAVPVRWLKQLIALFLIPPAWILTRAFFSCFSQATLNHSFWASEEFWFFALGAVLWLITFFGLPKPLLMYVFGHELTHVLWVWIMGGRVTRFRVGSEGGHIVTDTNNFWISLAPYFFPIYSLLVLAFYGGISVFWDLSPFHRWLFGLVGFTWMFHVTFTVWMLWNGQTDLVEHGTFFSMMVIYLMNFLGLSLMLILASRDVTFFSFGTELLQGAMDFSDAALHLVHLKA